MSDKESDAAKQAVIEIAIVMLGKLALRDSGAAYLTAHEATACYQALIDCLEVLNDEKEEN